MKNLSVANFILQNRDGIIIDVRTPAEYEKGHIVGAYNMPLFDNNERAVVGTIYKKQGRECAIEKGLDLVGQRLSQFIRKTRDILQQEGKRAEETTIYLYCWRGGMRSNSVGWLLSTVGFNVEVLSGGYKAYRRSFLSKLNIRHWKFIVLGGPTGSGKTDILQSIAKMGGQMLDLEGIACHRGSAFGSYGHQQEQPSSEHFANILYHQLLSFEPEKYIWCEGESLTIGKVFMPQEFYTQIQESKFIYFTLPREKRLQHIIRDYGDCPPEMLITAFRNITKRLGYDNAKKAIEMVENGDLYGASSIALTYYDKLYKSSIDSRVGNVIQQLEMPDDDPDKSAIELLKILQNEKN